MSRDDIEETLAVISIAEQDNEEDWVGLGKFGSFKKKLDCIHGKSRDPCYKDDGACYYNYGLGDSGNIRQYDPLYQYKTSSLPAAKSLNHYWDDTICSALRISPEDIANQLTLLDIPCFKAIQAEELTTCGWNKVNKLTIAPNVVAFTKRFNRVSFWTVQEILNRDSPKERAETMAHFIKVAKKLYDVNNLHSLFAVISALRSASIYRLSKTWSSLSKKDKQQFDKLAILFGEKNNWITLREYMNTISLPCIPYLGIFLTDLVYIDMAHPAGSPNRPKKMALILEALQRYQKSEYNLTPLPHVADYLNSVRYIEELQKFLEDDQYNHQNLTIFNNNPNSWLLLTMRKIRQISGICHLFMQLRPQLKKLGCRLSLKLEPPPATETRVESKDLGKEWCSHCPAAAASAAVSPHRVGSGSLRLQGNYQHIFVPTHRKCRSLGSNSIFGKCYTEEKVKERTSGSVNLLDDTLLESPSVTADDTTTKSLPLKNLPVCETLDSGLQGYVRRKTILKAGKKITLSSWQKYWLQIAGHYLVYYACKSFKGTSRSDFKSEKCKVLPLGGWVAMGVDNDSSDVFQLVNHQVGTVYKFKTGSESVAREWISRIGEVTNEMLKPLPHNLMTFESE